MRCSCLSLPPASITCLIIEGFLLICLFPSLAISKTLEPVTGQLNNTIAAKLTAVEVTLKDNVGKVVKSKVGDCLTLPLVCIFFSSLLCRMGLLGLFTVYFLHQPILPASCSPEHNGCDWSSSSRGDAGPHPGSI